MEFLFEMFTGLQRPMCQIWTILYFITNDVEGNLFYFLYPFEYQIYSENNFALLEDISVSFQLIYFQIVIMEMKFISTIN